MGLPRSAAMAAMASLLLFSPAPEAKASVESAERYFAQGRDLQIAEKYEEAAAAFERAVAEYPGHMGARYQLGIIWSRRIMDYDKAEKEFLSIPEIAMNSGGNTRNDMIFRSGLALGKLYIKRGKNERAIQIVRSILSSAPSGAALDDAFNALGLAYYYERSYDDAIFDLRRAIKLNPSNVDARFNLKTIRARLEHFNAGKVYSRTGGRKEAIAAFRKAISLDPRFIEARQRLGLELYLNGEYSEALVELRRAEIITTAYRKTYEIWYTQALALQALGREAEALRKLTATIEARPGFAAAHNKIGELLMAMGQYESAVNCFVKAIGIEPKTDYVRNLQAAMLKQKKNP